MMLITGMPRSGTTFLLNMFRDLGYKMRPKFFCTSTDYTGFPWISDEASAISWALARGIKGYDLIELFHMFHKIWYNECHDKMLVYKQPQLVFYRKELLSFDKIIICRRKLDSWIKSASIHAGVMSHLNPNNKPEWLNKYWTRIKGAESEILELGKIWEEQTDEVIGFLYENKKSYTVVDFGDEQSYTRLMDELGLDEVLIGYYLKEKWNGSNTDDKIKKF